MHTRSQERILTFSPGVYTTGSIFIKSNVHLRIDRELLLLGSQDFDDYPEMKNRIAGIETTWPATLINVLDDRMSQSPAKELSMQRQITLAQALEDA
ncbi:MAG: hypothetical protein IPK94_06185 [Saprospiraceae bacterium]|nr:hypothetical protein [Saprospiraceae bacterium]